MSANSFRMIWAWVGLLIDKISAQKPLVSLIYRYREIGLKYSRKAFSAPVSRARLYAMPYVRFEMEIHSWERSLVSLLVTETNGWPIINEDVSILHFSHL